MNCPIWPPGRFADSDCAAGVALTFAWHPRRLFDRLNYSFRKKRCHCVVERGLPERQHLATAFKERETVHFSRLPRMAKAVAALLVATTLPAAAQTRKPPRVNPAASAKTAHPDADVPFHAGEKLTFRVVWSKYSVNAATIEFSVVEHRDFFGHSAWHFRATAQTINTMRLVYPLDDQFDSYTDAGQLTSLQYETYLREQGKQQDSAWRMISDGSPAPPNVSAARVVPGTRDVIGLLYALRAVDWKKEPEFRSPVFDGRNLYDVVARLVEPSGQVTLTAGQATGSKIDVRVLQHGQEVAGTHFSLWLAQEATHAPLLIEAELPIGTARVEATALP
jgi:hypothetical protein